MTLNSRLGKLEAIRKAAQPQSDGAASRRLQEMLSLQMERLIAAGDIKDRTDVSPAERVARAWARGDREAAAQLLSKAVGREVAP